MNIFAKIMSTLSISVVLIGISLFLKGCGESSRRGYRIEQGNVVIYIGWPATRNIIGEADVASFIAINDTYGKDKNHVFYLGRIIPKADPATFAYLAGSYARDKNSGYSRDQQISQDGANFSVVLNPNETPANVTAEGCPYARDSHRVYKDTFIVEGADPATFAFVPMFNGYYLTHDHQRVYFQNKPLAGVDGATFRKVSDFHFSDKRGAWGLVLGKDIYWSPIPKVDLATFSAIGHYYAKDQHHVYFSNYAVVGADPTSFEETTYLEAQDKTGRYASGYRAIAKK